MLVQITNLLVYLVMKCNSIYLLANHVYIWPGAVTRASVQTQIEAATKLKQACVFLWSLIY